MDTAEHLESTLLCAAGFRHGFFTRRGGVSCGPFATLNFSLGVGDVEQSVRENFARAARALGVAPDEVAFLSQVHGREVLFARRGTVVELRRREGDALATLSPGIACGVRTADCVPLLMADRASGAVAAVHAGWRGLVNGVIAETCRALEELGARRDTLIVAIGPSISCRAFEVSEDVAQELASAARDPTVIDRSLGERPHADLRRVARAQLRSAGLVDTMIEDVSGCTYGDADRFFSFRRDGKVGGRHLSAIVCPGPPHHDGRA